MKSTRRITVLAAALLTTLASTHAWAHWCDDLWSSAYNIIVRPDSDTSPKELYVENHWGYQFTNFKLTATSSSGGTVTLTPPTTLKVKDTLLPGERGTWKITAGNPAKIEDLSFHVTFGDTSGATSKQWACYPVLGASPVMIIKNDGSLFPNAIAGIPKGTADLPKANTPNGCTYGDVPLGRSLQEQTIADWDDLDIGLDNILTLYCSGRGSWGNNDKAVKPNSYCKDANSTTCPSSKPTAIPGSRSDYMRLWGAGALAIRKGSLGTRLPTFRKRLMCGINDGDPGISGYTMFVLGYLGDDADSKKFLQDQASASGDGGTIAKAALYLMGDTSQKSAVQAGVKSSSVWVKVACAGALGIVDKDDDSVNSAIIPEVKWIEPDNMSGPTDNGKGMYSAHILEIVAADRRGWVFRGGGKGAITFYGEKDTPGAAGTSGSTGSTGAGGKSGTGGMTGTGVAGASGGSSAAPTSSVAPGGTPSSSSRSGSGGASAASSSDSPKGGSSAAGGAASSGGQQASSSERKSSESSSSGAAGDKTSSSSAQGGAASSSSDESSKKASGDSGNSCSCNLGGRAPGSELLLSALAGLALLLVRRRRS